MDKQKVKVMLSREVLNYLDGASARVLKTIIFDDETSINWDKAYDAIMTFMPELKKYEGYKPENMI